MSAPHTGLPCATEADAADEKREAPAAGPGHVAGLPSHWYCDADVYRRELTQIFRRSWTLVAPELRLANPGDQVLATLGEVPVVVARDLDGTLRGFVNVCRHRAHPVVLADGQRRTLQCRYHGWTYGLDGRLRGVPRCGSEQVFEKAELGLLPVTVASWRGLVFAHPDRDAAPLLELHPALRDLPERDGVDWRGLQHAGRWTYEIAANWKVWVENASECYHCPTVHRGSFSDAFDVSQERYTYAESGSLMGQFTAYQARVGAHRNGPYAGFGGGGRAGLGGDGRAGYRYFYLFPASLWSQDDHVSFSGAVVPTGTQSCRIVIDAFARPDADPDLLQRWLQMYDETQREDQQVVSAQQAALRSGMLEHGNLMPRSDRAILHFHRLVRESLAGQP